MYPRWSGFSLRSEQCARPSRRRPLASAMAGPDSRQPCSATAVKGRGSANSRNMRMKLRTVISCAMRLVHRLEVGDR
jgi:hypothetical protein